MWLKLKRWKEKCSAGRRNLAVLGESLGVVICGERNFQDRLAKSLFDGGFSVGGLFACRVYSRTKMRPSSKLGAWELGWFGPARILGFGRWVGANFYDVAC